MAAPDVRTGGAGRYAGGRMQWEVEVTQERPAT